MIYGVAERYGENARVALTLGASRKRFLLAILPVGLAVWAQWALFTQKLVLDGVVLFSLAAALFVLHVLRGQRLVNPVARQAAVTYPGEVARRAYGKLPGLALGGCVILAWVFSDGNRFRKETVLFWVLSVALYLWLAWERGGGAGPSLAERIRSLARRDMTLSWSAVALGLVILLAAFFRYYQIGSVPAEPTSDHAEKLLDVRDLLRGQYSIFFPRNTGREALQFYLALPFVSVFGLNFLALKVLTATISLLAVPTVYLIGKEVADARFGLLAAFFLAVSKWDVSIGRNGLRYPLASFFSALAFLFLLRALRHGRRKDYLLCGLVTGIGLYGYSPFRAMVLLLGVAVLIKLAFEARSGFGVLLSTVKNAALALGTILVVMIPMAHYMSENPKMFWFRALTRVSSTEVPLPPNPLQVLMGNVANWALMFNWRGDVVWTTNVPYDPSLDYVSGALFLLGVVWCLFTLIKHREPVAAYLLACLLVMMLPSVLAIAFPNENPSLVRSGGTLAVVPLLIAAPVYLVMRRAVAAWPGRSSLWLSTAMLLVLLVLTARLNFDRYFVDYSASFRQSARNSTEVAMVIDAFVRSVGPRENVFIQGWPHWIDTRNVAFTMGAPDWNNVIMTASDIARHNPPPGNKLYIINKADKESVRIYQQRFPEGQLHEQASVAPGQEFLVFFVPGRP